MHQKMDGLNALMEYQRTAEQNAPGDVSICAAIARRSQRRLSRIAKGPQTRCYSP
jgi:hypothetical protein